jgi:hypothetical protein
LRSSLLEKRVGKVLRRSFLEKSILLCRRWKCQRYTVAALRSSQRTAFRSSPPPPNHGRGQHLHVPFRIDTYTC